MSVAVRGGQQSLMDGTVRAAGTVGQRLGWKVTGQYLTADDFEPDPDASTHYYGSPHFEGNLIEDYGVESKKAEGFLYYRFADGWQARVGGGWSENDNFGLTNNGRNHIRGWQVNFQTAQVSSEHWYAQFTRTGNDAGKTYQLNQLAAGTAAMEEVDPPALDPIREALKFVDRGELYDSEIQYHNEFAGVEVTTGAQYRQYRPDSDGTFLADANDEDIDATELGGYLQLDTRLLGDRLRLVGAARVDNHSNYDTQFSPKAAAVFTVAPAHNVRVGYNRAFKSPTVLEKAAPLARSGRPRTRRGRPMRTCCPRIRGASVSRPGISLPPPVRTTDWLGRLSKPAASRQARTSSRISSTRGRMMPMRSDRVMVRRSRSQSPLAPPSSMTSRSSMPVATTPPWNVLIRSAVSQGT